MARSWALLQVRAELIQPTMPRPPVFLDPAGGVLKLPRAER
jgi:hypothetical protein